MKPEELSNEELAAHVDQTICDRINDGVACPLCDEAARRLRLLDGIGDPEAFVRDAKAVVDDARESIGYSVVKKSMMDALARHFPEAKT